MSRLVKRLRKLAKGRTLPVRLKSRRMLLEPLATISEVAEKCGFSDAAYFARVFRSITGCSPSEYRNEPMREATVAPAPAP